MPKIFIGGDAEYEAASAKAGRQLEVSEVSASVATYEPVLLLGKIIVADSRAMQFVQRLFGRPKIGGIINRLCEVKSYTVNESSYESLPAGP
jgi:hypothetical protein